MNEQFGSLSAASASLLWDCLDSAARFEAAYCAVKYAKPMGSRVFARIANATRPQPWGDAHWGSASKLEPRQEGLLVLIHLPCIHCEIRTRLALPAVTLRPSAAQQTWTQWRWVTMSS